MRTVRLDEAAWSVPGESGVIMCVMEEFLFTKRRYYLFLEILVF
jgi:hypothetical protein